MKNTKISQIMNMNKFSNNFFFQIMSLAHNETAARTISIEKKMYNEVTNRLHTLTV